MGKFTHLSAFAMLAFGCSSGVTPTETRGPIDGEGEGGTAGAGAADGGAAGEGNEQGGASGEAGASGTDPVECEPELPPESSAEFLCDPSGDLACNNCNDCGLVMDGSAKSEATTCGVQCGSSLSCAEDCLTNNIGLSGECTGCLVDFFDCLKANCLAQCLGTTPDACTECSRTKPEGESCSEALETCSGATRNEDFSG